MVDYRVVSIAIHLAVRKTDNEMRVTDFNYYDPKVLDRNVIEVQLGKRDR